MKKQILSTKDLAHENTTQKEDKFKVPTQKPNFKDVNSFINSLYFVGNQSTNLSKAIEALKHEKFVLAFSSNIISTGLRGLVIDLIRKDLVKRVVTTAGGVEEDIIKIHNDTYICGFDQSGEYLRKNGMNRIGGVLMKNDSYELLETILNECFNLILKDKKDDDVLKITPTKFLKKVGNKILDLTNKENINSVLTSCIEKNIPYNPVCLTDGSFGDILSFYIRNKEIFLDIVGDFKESNCEKPTNVLIIGDGNVKNRVLSDQKNIKNVVILTSKEYYDGSDIVETNFSAKNIIRVYGDATITFPLLFGGLTLDF